MKNSTIRKATAAHAKRVRLAALADKLLRLSSNEIAAQIRTQSDGFTLSKEWRDLRLKAADLYGTACAKCGAGQTRQKRVNFDHIKPRKFFPELALDIGNLQPLCPRCNKNKGNGPAVDYRPAASS